MIGASGYGVDMRAFVKSSSAADSVCQAEVEVPQAEAGELLIRLQAIGVGIHDSYFLPPGAGPLHPIGIEGAGLVERVGDGVTGHHQGDRVAFISSMQPKGGTWAEYAVVGADSLVVPVPSQLSFVATAALPVAGSTVLRTFAALGDLPAGASVFVAGGSGAIGTLAIQLARHRGWRVVASASTPNHDYMRSLGAELAVDYRSAGWVDDVRRWLRAGLDAAIAIQPGTTAECMRVVQDNGRVVTVSGDDVSGERGIRVGMIDYQVDVRDDLADMMSAVAENELHLEIERVHPFDEAAQALARVQTRHVRGKLVLRL